MDHLVGFTLLLLLLEGRELMGERDFWEYHLVNGK